MEKLHFKVKQAFIFAKLKQQTDKQMKQGKPGRNAVKYSFKTKMLKWRFPQPPKTYILLMEQHNISCFPLTIFSTAFIVFVDNKVCFLNTWNEMKLNARVSDHFFAL